MATGTLNVATTTTSYIPYFWLFFSQTVEKVMLVLFVKTFLLRNFFTQIKIKMDCFMLPLSKKKIGDNVTSVSTFVATLVIMLDTADLVS